MIDRKPHAPTAAEWTELYHMLCGHCALQTRCDVTEAMIEMKDGGAWPEGGWVSDPGAGVTCLSYVPRPGKPISRQQVRHMARQREENLPPVCGGCAAQKGSEASVSLHTQRDYQAAVRNRTRFGCHEDPAIEKRPCGGWCRAVIQRAQRG